MPGSIRKDDRDHFIFLNGVLETEAVTLVSIYAPNSHGLLADSFQELSLFATGTILLGGDFNMVAHIAKDKSHKRILCEAPKHSHRKLADLFANLTSVIYGAYNSRMKKTTHIPLPF